MYHIEDYTTAALNLDSFYVHDFDTWTSHVGMALSLRFESGTGGMPNVGAESTNTLLLLESTQGILNTFCAKPMVPTMNLTECAVAGAALGGQKFFDPVGQGLKFKVRP